jgi:transcriptional regulator with XRE-family HTH domain
MTSTRPKLRALREERGWTQQDVADQVARMAWLRRHERVGVNADMVSKWERGQKRPTPLYRDMLAEVFSVEPHDLGLGGPAPADPAARSEVDGNSLIEMLGGAASLLDQLGAAGAILQPRMFDVWKDELMQRRALLKLMGLATTAGVVPALDRDSARSGKATPSDVQDLDHLADRYQALYHSTAPAVLMTPVVAHLETLRDFLRQGTSAQLRRKLFANRVPGRDPGRAAGVLRPERLARHARVLQPGAGICPRGGRSPPGRRCAQARGVHPGSRVLLQRGA